MPSEGKGAGAAARVLAIQHVAEEPPGAVRRALEEARLGVEVIRVDLGQAVPREIGDAAGLVVMGGPMGVYEVELHPHLADEVALLQDALRRGRPVLGICLGSQLLAAALGAGVRASGRKEIGWLPVHLRDAAAEDALLAGLPASFTALHWHGDVFDLPAGAVALASSEITVHQAFRHGRAAYGILFHLEVTPEQIEEMSVAFAGELGEAGLSPGALASGTARHAGELRRLGDLVFSRWAGLVREARAAAGSR